jgi:exosome complex exonuclease DIS3/RRP44
MFVLLLCQVRDETGYILFIRQNAIQVLIPKYGLEGTLFLRVPGSKTVGPNFEFDDSVPTQKCGNVVLSLFQKVTVQVRVNWCFNVHIGIL